MKITVINLKSIIKYIFIFFIIIFVIILLIKSIKGNKNDDVIDNKNTLIECLKYEVPITKIVEENMDDYSYGGSKTILGMKILSLQIGLFDNIVKKDETVEIVSQPLAEDTLVSQEKNVETIAETTEDNNDVKETRVITENNIAETYTNKYKDIKINNQTKFDVTSILENASYTFNNSKKVIIYHTHTCEAYTATEMYNYKMTDSYRTTDLNYTVSRVGDELSLELEKRGFNVIHSKTYHDYPSYNGSYGRSLKTLESILSENRDAEIAIDLHRDAVGSKSNYAPSVQIDNEVCAQVMFVVGTNGSGLSHNNWRQNLQYAIKVQSVADELYPGLFRPIILRDARYNQHLTTASTIIEVGATGNTLEQCLASMKYVAEVINKATQE